MKRRNKENLFAALAILAFAFTTPSCTAIWLASVVAESCEEEIEQVGEAVLQAADEEAE